MSDEFVVRGFYDKDVFVVKQNAEQDKISSNSETLYFDESRVNLLDGNEYLHYSRWGNTDQNLIRESVSNNVEGYKEVQGEIVLSVHDIGGHFGPTELIQNQVVPLRKNNFYHFCIYVATHRAKAAIIIQLLDENQNVIREIEKSIAADIAGGKQLNSYKLVREYFRAGESENYFRIKLRKYSTLYGDDSFVFLVSPCLNILRSNALAEVLKVPAPFLNMLYKTIEINSALTVSKLKSDDINQAEANIWPSNVFGTFNGDRKSNENQDSSIVPIINSEPSNFYLSRHLPSKDILKIVIGVVIYNNSQQELSNLGRQSRRSMEYLKRQLDARGISIEYESVYIDNSPNKITIPEEMKDWTSLHSWSNSGFAGGHNLLMTHSFRTGSCADYYIMVNPDGYPLEDCYYNMITTAYYNIDVGLVEASQFPIEHPKSYDPITLETPWCSGACLLVSRAAYNSTTGFDENFVMYCEDVDLSWRVRDAGLKILYMPRAAFFHDVRDRSSKQTRRSMLISGRYLAHKWGAPDFVRWVEGMLVTEGHFPSAEYLPLLSAPVVKRVPDSCEFRQGFYFSLPRW
jgi:GT2 family glycosyltransferase